ncbi:hypothetical protein CHS0354_011090 [Potamilus streckersoni]|uniref:Uncharacterized protein n=1 Tax=Potamilus streckersoni TaxID=2493646 RepID=A0AAE0TCV2_9BIVA|nr:hypothetical protein CHS0354_011090 [Potamilus streckersoni]
MERNPMERNPMELERSPMERNPMERNPMEKPTYNLKVIFLNIPFQLAIMDERKGLDTESVKLVHLGSCEQTSTDTTLALS